MRRSRGEGWKERTEVLGTKGSRSCQGGEGWGLTWDRQEETLDAIHAKDFRFYQEARGISTSTF